jgi:hypothetical protein
MGKLSGSETFGDIFKFKCIDKRKLVRLERF